MGTTEFRLPIPDLSTSPAQARGSLVKFQVRRDPDGSGPDDLLFDIDVAHMVDANSATDLAALDANVPGAASLVQSASAGGGAPGSQTRARLAHAVDRGDRWVSIADGNGKVLVNARKSEVRGVTVKVAGPIATMTVRHRVRGMDPLDAARLMRSLDGEIDVEVVDAQQTLFPGAGSAAGSGRKSAIGKGWCGSGSNGIGLVVIGAIVVPGGSRRDVCGVVQSVTSDPSGIGGEMLCVRDTTNGEPAVYLTSNDVTQTISIAAPDGQTIDDVLEGYRKGCEADGFDPSWSSLIEACGNLYAEDGVSFGPNGEFVIDDRVVTRALDLARADAA